MSKLQNYIIWERPCYPGLVYYAAEAVVRPHAKYFGRPWCKTYGFWRQGMVLFAWPKKEFAGNAAYIGKNFSKDPYFRSKVKINDKLEREMTEYLVKIGRTDLKKLTDDELLESIRVYYHYYLEWWGFAQVAEPAAKGLEIILKKFRRLHQEELNVVAAPLAESYTVAEENELLNFALAFKKRGSLPRKKLRDHVKRYFWLNNTFAKTYYLDESFFLRRIKSLAKKHAAWEISNILKANQERLSEIRERNSDLMKDLKFNAFEKKITGRIGWLADYQDKRKAFSMMLNHYSDSYIKEITRRSGLSYDLAKFAIPQEYASILNRSFPVSKLKSRQSHLAIIFTMKGARLVEGQPAVELETKLLGKGIEKRVNEFEGQRAMGGKVRGRVRVILNSEQLRQMRHGEILVTTMTSPDFVPAMKKAAAVVTDEGGITCHAAVISRELGVPCVTGTKIATRLLKNGDIIEVNANHGLVKIIRN